MKLSIVTINYNDAVGLQKTLQSVASQATGDRLQAIGYRRQVIGYRQSGLMRKIKACITL